VNEVNATDAAPKRPRFEPISLGGVARTGARWIYVFAAISCAGVAAYMFGVEHRSMTSGYVVAPAIGALWFGLRAFMMLGK
jgi:hypothetical protein